MGFIDWIVAWDSKRQQRLKPKKRKKTWAERNKWQLKRDARAEKQAQRRKHFKSIDEAFTYWFAEYNGLPKRLRRWLILKGMQNSDYRVGKRLSSGELPSKIAEIDWARETARKRTILMGFEYLFTFTYDGAKNTEQTFRKGVVKCLRRLGRKKGWKYVGVWQRSRNNKRLYLQALVQTGDGEIIGGLEKVRDFQTRRKWMKTTLQSPYFNERFGRTSVEILDKEKAAAYRHHLDSFLQAFNKKKAKIIASRRMPYRLLKGTSAEIIE